MQVVSNAGGMVAASQPALASQILTDLITMAISQQEVKPTKIQRNVKTLIEKQKNKPCQLETLLKHYLQTFNVKPNYANSCKKITTFKSFAQINIKTKKITFCTGFQQHSATSFTRQTFTHLSTLTTRTMNIR